MTEFQNPPVGTFDFLDLSGFIVSGKQAYSDLIREFDGYLVPAPEVEFELIRIQGGIRELENALIYDWSPIRSDAAIRKFRTVVRRFGSRNSWFSPASWCTAVGWNYDDYFKCQFFNLADEYLRSLSAASWRTNWPYPRADLCDHELFGRKLLSLFGCKRAMDFDINLAKPSAFFDATRRFLETLLATRAEPETRTIVTHNAFEQFNPMRAIRYFSRAKCIIVDRDPRDSFVAMAPHRHLALKVDDFIERFRLFRAQVRHDSTEGQHVLRIRFEDLVFNYDAAVARVIGFLGHDNTIHRHKQKYFVPESSAKNIGLFKAYKYQADIARIERSLGEFCDPRASRS